MQWLPAHFVVANDKRIWKSNPKNSITLIFIMNQAVIKLYQNWKSNLYLLGIINEFLTKIFQYSLLRLHLALYFPKYFHLITSINFIRQKIYIFFNRHSNSTEWDFFCVPIVLYRYCVCKSLLKVKALTSKLRFMRSGPRIPKSLKLQCSSSCLIIFASTDFLISFLCSYKLSLFQVWKSRTAPKTKCVFP